MIEKYLKLYICLLLGAIACSIGIGSAKIDELTQKHANEFRIVYESHLSTLILALKTRDVSLLEKTSTGYELQRLTRIVNSQDADQYLKGYEEFEVMEIEVTEYSEANARIRVRQWVPQNPSGYGELLFICELQKKEMSWKISRCQTPNFE